MVQRDPGTVRLEWRGKPGGAPREVRLRFRAIGAGESRWFWSGLLARDAEGRQKTLEAVSGSLTVRAPQAEPVAGAPEVSKQ